jgi:DNA-binding NarL/FixJ family response regulator
MIRVFVVHQTSLFCELTSAVLAEEKDIRITCQVTSVNETLCRLGNGNCDVLLISANMPDNGALKLTESIQQSHPNVKVIVFGVPELKNVILQYIAAGAAGYVPEKSSVEVLVDSIRAAHEDKALVSPTIAAALMSRLAELSQVTPWFKMSTAAYAGLTQRECEVLNLIAEGSSNQEIAQELVIEVGTVKNHVHNILKKLDVRSRQDAATFYALIQEQHQNTHSASEHRHLPLASALSGALKAAVPAAAH